MHDSEHRKNNGTQGDESETVSVHFNEEINRKNNVNFTHGHARVEVAYSWRDRAKVSHGNSCLCIHLESYLGRNMSLNGMDSFAIAFCVRSSGW